MSTSISAIFNQLLLLLLVVPSTAATHGHAACLPRERDALLAFKRAITSDPAGQLASWRRGGGQEDCCRWRGVRCSNRTGHVLQLRLHNTHADDCVGISCAGTAMAGQISPSLLALQHLAHLDLSVQLLQGRTGRVPEFLGSLSNLRYLNLSCVPFSGSLPPQLGNLSKLRHLDLSQAHDANLLESRAPMYSADISWLARLPLLRYLNMQQVNLRMVVDWPHVVNMIPSLRELDLTDCSLQSANLPNLEELDLSFNDFGHPIASCWFWNITSLRYLGLWYTNLYGQFPYALGDLESLETFGLSTNRMVSITASSMRKLCNLEILDLSNCLLDENVEDILERIPQCSRNNLRKLYLWNNNITGVLPNWIREFNGLLVLDLSQNLLTGPMPSEIGMLGNLTYLGLGSNIFGGMVMTQHYRKIPFSRVLAYKP